MHLAENLLDDIALLDVEERELAAFVSLRGEPGRQPQNDRKHFVLDLEKY